ncbi:MAG: hypothetical protein EOM20_08865 [Spartobacteria bacterium]|nr:hypothetical protein [Spartobacteria bacterium]
MTENNGQSNEKQPEAPKKDKLGGPGGVQRIQRPGSMKKPAPKPPVVKDKKSETSRIDLSEAMTPEDASNEKVPTLQQAMATPPVEPLPSPVQMQTDLGHTDEEAKKSTIRIDASETQELPTGSGIVSEMSEDELAALEESAKRSTIRIDMPLAEPKKPVVDEDSKKSTIKIESKEEEALPPGSGIVADMDEDELAQMGEHAKSSTIRIDMPEEKPVSAPSLEEAKKSTIRIDAPAENLKNVQPEDITEATKKQTVRVQVDDLANKGDTQRVDGKAIEHQMAEGLRKTTTRLDMGEVITTEDDADIFKKRTAVLDASKFTKARDGQTGPRTIRIKRPTQTPPTAILSSPVAPPTAPISHAPTPIAVPSVEDAKKSETARIELPPEAEGGAKLHTRRKTVRIKRPDGTSASRELTISKPTVMPSRSMSRVEKTEVPGEMDIHPVFPILALCAAIITLVLLYILAAQTIAPGLPFPGRLG